MNTLRILHLVDSLDGGGMEAQLVSLLNRLSGPDFKFHVHCLRHGGLHSSRLNADIGLSLGHKREGLNFKALLGVHSLLNRPWDLIHTHNWGPLFYAWLASLGGRRLPILHGEHAELSQAHQCGLRRAARLALHRDCIAIHTVSTQQRDQLIAQGFDHPKLLALTNGVDTMRFSPGRKSEARTQLGLDPQSLILGCVARFGERKRHLELIEAFELLHAANPNLQLICVGNGGPMQTRVEQRVATSKARANIRLVGHQEQPERWYQAMDLLVVASDSEGLSNATLEAMACACPVLSHQVCGATDALGPFSQGGWIRNLSQPADIAAAVNLVMTLTHDERRRIGHEGRQRALNEFGWDMMAQRYAALYRSLCGRDSSVQMR